MIDVHSLNESDTNAEGLAYWVQDEEPDLLGVINQGIRIIKRSHDQFENIYRFYQDNGTCGTHYVFPRVR
ncbi:hypothetical protein JQC92_19960 [Shewanella sp. 202IG2-18]|uniref:hypothetical protein n=1 Tax=Parashewanella hymeniacidonis TaxID=2807618 RepID=UPI00196116FA|nr:hypothetical protein [Parashewanella hymeniacidonis]MBM7074272.1 hypothetical protein [Parashewanella hymeniacidonis]